MSGGHFDYQQFRLEDMASQIEQDIDSGRCSMYGEATIEKFRESAATARLAGEMLTRVDWLMSDDDGEKTLHERWDKIGFPDDWATRRLQAFSP